VRIIQPSHGIIFTLQSVLRYGRTGTFDTRWINGNIFHASRGLLGALNARETLERSLGLRVGQRATKFHGWFASDRLVIHRWLHGTSGAGSSKLLLHYPRDTVTRAITRSPREPSALC